MALAWAVEGARHVPQRITWTDEDGDAVNLTGATITGRLRSTNDGTARNIDGSLTIITAASGIFDWDYGAVDVGTPGIYMAQFTATYGALDLDRSLSVEWRVEPAL